VRLQAGVQNDAIVTRALPLQALWRRMANATAKDKSRNKKTILTTSGELFPDGSAIELVSDPSANNNGLALLLWNGTRSVIAPTAEHDGKVYEPPDLHASIHRAVKLPREATPYGTTKILVANIREVFEHYVGLPVNEATLLAMWAITTWVSDCVSSPPNLLLSGVDASLGVTVLLGLSCLSRHPLPLTDITRRAFCSLVPLLRPTLLVNQPGLSPKILALWHATNFRGLFVPGNADTIVNVTCSKAFFGGMDTPACPWTDASIHLALSPAQNHLPRLTQHQQEEIAERYQPQLLMYRLQNFRRVLESRTAAHDSKSSNSGIARDLATCFQDEQNLLQAVTPLLQSQEQDAAARRGCDTNLVIIEVIWLPSHEAREISVSEITDLINALLRDRDSTLEYSAEEIGWRLRDLGFCRHRNGRGMVLQFSRENILRVHQLAQRFGLNLSAADGCADCVRRK
jgi:hypothetical protein